jgi:hypothetical protein
MLLVFAGVTFVVCGLQAATSFAYCQTKLPAASLARPWQAPPAYSRLFQILFQVSQVGYSQHME